MVDGRVAVIDGRAGARRRPVAVAHVGSNGRAAKQICFGLPTDVVKARSWELRPRDE
jgi:hypothetical protein